MSNLLGWLPGFRELKDIRIGVKILYKNILGATFVSDSVYLLPHATYQESVTQDTILRIMEVLERVQRDLDEEIASNKSKLEDPKGEDSRDFLKLKIITAQQTLNEALGVVDHEAQPWRGAQTTFLYIGGFKRCLRQNIRVATEEDIDFFQQKLPGYEATPM